MNTLNKLSQLSTQHCRATNCTKIFHVLVGLKKKKDLQEIRLQTVINKRTNKHNDDDNLQFIIYNFFLSFFLSSLFIMF